MSIFKEGDKSKGTCYSCKKLVSTTFRFADCKINELVFNNILQGFCDKCGSAVSIPHQSALIIKEKKEKYERENK